MPTPNSPTIPALASLLDAHPDRPLTEDERVLLRAALTELAAAHATLARQATLLASYENDVREIEAAAAGELDRLRHLTSGPGPIGSYDRAAAEMARSELLAKVNLASEGKDILEAVLRFVAVASGLVG